MAKRGFEPNTDEWRAWMMHHDGMSVSQIARALRIDYRRIKDIILYGWSNDVVRFGKKRTSKASDSR